MSIAKAKEWNAKATAEFVMCKDLHEKYGEAVKALSQARKAKKPAADLEKLDVSANAKLSLLGLKSKDFDKAIDEMNKELQKVPLNGPDAAAAKELHAELKAHKNIAQVFRKDRAREFWQKKYP